MQKSILYRFLFILSLALPLCVLAQSNSQYTPSPKKWLKKKVWADGLKINPHKSVDAKQFAEQYFKNKKYWDEAFSFLKDHDLQTIAKEYTV